MSRDGIKEFHQAIQNYKLRPILIYTPEVDVLATAWGQHRLQQGRRWNVIENDLNHLGISVAALNKLLLETL